MGSKIPSPWERTWTLSRMEGEISPSPWRTRKDGTSSQGIGRKMPCAWRENSSFGKREPSSLGGDQAS